MVKTRFSCPRVIRILPLARCDTLWSIQRTASVWGGLLSKLHAT